ncbi:MAG: glycosyltransferase [Sphaerospermopsis sp. SIO1G2]|nr:glycosyltransferase [Sphaerospermopsis sp. SIO1G1]NET71641.1 glycosyltransferase [Sphaerospermopsis sp. SIO1G2]
MKVLHIYAGNLFGGIETLLITLIKQQYLCSQMYHHFALCFEGRLAHELRTLNAKVNILGKVKISYPWTVWKARKELQQLLNQEKFDVVVCHSCWPQAIFGSVVRANNLPLVFWCHDVPNGKHPVERLAKLIPPDIVIANSRFTQSSVPKLYSTHSEILYLPVAEPNLNNHLSRQQVRAELNTADDAVVIIQASRLEKWKGQSILLSALGRLRDLPNWMCWIAGGVQRPHEGEYLVELKQQAQELGIADRVLFLGQRQDVPSLLAAADIHCQPNTGAEPFGIAFIEALYAGLPVVTTAIGGAMEIVNSSCGELVAPDDINALSAVLATLISNPNQRIKLASGGKAQADYLCNPQNQLNKLYGLLCQLVKQNAAA